MLNRGLTCTQLHETNVMIAHARDSNIPADLAKIRAQIDEKFTDVFIHKTRSVVCRRCTKEISLIGNLFGNLSQHVGSATHKQNMSRLRSVSSRQLTAFFKPTSTILDDKQTLTGVLTTVARNFHVQKNVISHCVRNFYVNLVVFPDSN